MSRYRVIADALELRAGPSTDDPILETLPNATELEPVPPNPHWTQVKRIADGRIGWVYNAYIRPVPEGEPLAPKQTPESHRDEAAPAESKAAPQPAVDDAKASDLVFDVSHFQPYVHWQAAYAAGLRGCFHKATEGTGYVDPLYHTSRAQARGAGLLWGAYHFGTGDDAVAQAEHFLATAQPDGKTLLALDLERNPEGASMSIEQARTFIQHIHEQTGKWPGLYSGSYIRDHLGGGRDEVLANCWFWLAEYGSVAHVPGNWSAWTFWQHTDGRVGPGPHVVPGTGPVDRDRFAGSAQQLVDFWHANSPAGP
jgi:lysozyme